jgi:hypothetical protein
MTIKKILISLVLVAILAITAISCNGTKNICPAYSDATTEMQQDQTNS